MKIAVLSDIHANFPALAAVLDDAAGQGIDLDGKACWCLGDVVGYGPHPAEAVAFLNHYVDPKAWVMGNHDAMLADLLIPEDLEKVKDGAGLVKSKTQHGEGAEVVSRGQFLDSDDWFQTNASPIRGIELNRAALAGHLREDRFWRESFLPSRKATLGFRKEAVDYTLVHCSQSKPISRLIYPWNTAILLPKEFEQLQKGSQGVPRVQWFGHTHVPTLVYARPRKEDGGLDISPVKVWPQESYPLDAEWTLVNPGSVGQPRNLDTRASYAILDTHLRTVTFRRVAYNWRDTARDLQAGDYPESFINRLRTAEAVQETPDDWLAYYREAAGR